METLKQCPVCLGEKFDPFVNISYWHKGVYHLCEGCGAAFLSPRMDEAELTEWYRSGNYRERTGEGDPGNQQGIKQAQGRADYIAAMLTGDINSHLDIGCWRGDLLRAVRRNRMAMLSIGVDVAPEQDEFACYTDLANVPGQFDLITCTQTLEHVNDPRRMVAGIREHLAPTGIFIIEVPNRRASLKAFLPPQHVVAYDQHSLEVLLADFHNLHFNFHGAPFNSPLDENILVFGRL